VNTSPRVLPDWIEGDGVLLRRWRVEDAEALGRAVTESREHLRPWMHFIAHEPMALSERRAMLRTWELEWLAGGDVLLGIFVGEEVAGGCGLHRRLGPCALEMGYWVHPSFVRQGLGTAVARLLTDAAFSVPGISHVEIHTAKANLASAAIPRRLGYEYLGETEGERTAPPELGVDCGWRVDRAQWQRLSAG